MQIQTISSIDVVQGSFVCSTELQIRWYDDRLKWNINKQNISRVNINSWNLWLPDLFI